MPDLRLAAALLAALAPLPEKPVADLARRDAAITAPLPADQAALKAHVMFLASDAMRGRDAGSPEYDIVANYVASQFYAAGLRPAGDGGGYLQRVPLISVRPAGKGNFTLTIRGGRSVPLTFGEEYLPGIDVARATTAVDAPLAFVGYGIVTPTARRDDYAGIDVRGRIVLMFAGAPGSFNGEERAHFGSTSAKAAIAERKGAAGVIVIQNPKTAKAAPFSAGVGSYDRARVTWAQADGAGFTPSPRAPVLGTISAGAAARLFGTRWAAVARGAGSSETRFTPVQLPARLAVTIRSVATPLPSSNVAGILPGSDSAIGDEVVVLSAHLDHVGVGKAVNGDAIYNGAEDNAVGVAALIEEAKRFRTSGRPPRRSILFLAVTAEERGLVGADYFARNPTVPKSRIVANVNLDMPIITYRFEDIIAFGAERSTLGPIVRRAAAGIGVSFSPDPMPDQALFVRSDHYRFVQQGVPSVFLWPGQAGPGKAAVEDFFKNHYHQPSDEVGLPALDWSQGVRFVDVNYAIAREIADADARPRWNKGDFFGTLYGGYGAK